MKPHHEERKALFAKAVRTKEVSVEEMGEVMALLSRDEQIALQYSLKAMGIKITNGSEATAAAG